MKRYTILVLMAWAVLLVSAANVNEQAARQLAMDFIGQKGTRSAATTLERVYLPLETTAAQWSATDAPVYAFNCSGGGYVLVSGDERAASVLGFSRQGSLDADRMPLNMRNWLQSYAKKIERLQQGRVTLRRAATRAASDKSDIEPILNTTWGQDYPYNLHTPQLRLKWESRDTTIHAAAGCVATAMSQVLNYYRYPAETLAEVESYTGTAQVPVYSSRKEKVDTLLVDYKTEAVAKGTAIDWEHIVDNYDIYDEFGNLSSYYNNTAEEREAVSRLMQYCGVASEMEYGFESGTWVASACTALYNMFGYKGCYVLYQYDYDDDQEWVDVVYNEISEAGPVMFSGNTPTQGGHEFVLDGYQSVDGKDYFHVNWGWDGMSDGFMLLDVLEPGWIYNDDDETEGFTEYQDMMCGLGKNGVAKTSCQMPKLETVKFSIGEPDKTYRRSSKVDPFEIDKFNIAFINSHLPYINTSVALVMYDQNGEVKSYLFINDPSDGLEFFFYYYLEIDEEVGTLPLGEKLTEGTYTIVPCTTGIGYNDFEPMQFADDYPVVMTIKGNKATFSEGQHTAIKGISMTDDEMEEASGFTSDAPWYTLSGQRLDSKPNKGIYIRNGRKVVLK